MISPPIERASSAAMERPRPRAAPRCAFPSRAGRVRAVEAIEDAREVLRGDALAVVRDSDLHAVPVACDADHDVAPGRRVLDRVVAERAEHLTRAGQVRAGPHGRDLRRHRHRALLRERRELRRDLLGDVRDRDGLQLHLLVGGVEPRQIEQVAEQLRQLLRVALQPRHLLACGLRERPRVTLEHLRARPQDRHGRAQLVARVRDEPALAIHRRLDRPHRAPREEPAPHGREEQPRRAREQQRRERPREGPAALAQGLHHLHGPDDAAVVRDRHGEQAHRLAPRGALLGAFLAVQRRPQRVVIREADHRRAPVRSHGRASRRDRKNEQIRRLLGRLVPATVAPRPGVLASVAIPGPRAMFVVVATLAPRAAFVVLVVVTPATRLVVLVALPVKIRQQPRGGAPRPVAQIVIDRELVRAHLAPHGGADRHGEHGREDHEVPRREAQADAREGHHRPRA